jgi:hypothetical protein
MRIRQARRALASVVLVGALIATLATSAVAGEDSDKGEKDGKDAKEKVTICHRTNSDKHPYVEISVGAKGAIKGHGAHHAATVVWGPKLKADHQRWGDIIPAFDVGGTHFDGLNLDTEGGANGDTSGQSILDGHCKAAGIGTT